MITIFENINATNQPHHITPGIVVDRIKNGKSKEKVLKVREQKTKAQADRYKKDLPCILWSGEFKNRSIDGLIEHSGLICLDIDSLEDPHSMKAKLKNDEFVFCCFVSPSGKGVKVVVKIPPITGDNINDEQRKYWNALNTYFNHKLDGAAKDVSRICFESYDPGIYYAKDSKIWTSKLDFEKPEGYKRSAIKEAPEILQICANMIRNAAEGEKHNVLLRASRLAGGFVSGDLVDEQLATQVLEQEIQKKSLNSFPDAQKTIQKGIAHGKGDPIREVKTKKKSESYEVVRCILDHWDLQYNEMVNDYEVDGRPIMDKDLNNMFILVKEMGHKVRFENMCRYIDSDLVPSYHPVLDMIKRNQDHSTGHLQAYCDTFKVDQVQELFNDLFKKWYCNMVAMACGITNENPLFMCYLGKQNIGKTQAFRRLLPRELHDNYYAEHEIRRDKDFLIEMARRIVIMDDELDGKTKQDVATFKALTSTSRITVRKPFGRKSMQAPRLATLCGTGNHSDILTDTTGNRRILPFELVNVALDAMDKVDKGAMFIEGYNLVSEGFNFLMTKEDIERLEKFSEGHYKVNIEQESIGDYLTVLDPGKHNFKSEFLSTTQILTALMDITKLRNLNAVKLGRTIKDLGYTSAVKKVGGKAKRGFWISGDCQVGRYYQTNETKNV